MRNKYRGFTLVELLIVIMIIGILATMAVPQYQKMVEKAKWATTRPILDQIRKMELVYYMQYGVYTDVGSGQDPNSNWEKIGMDSPNLNPNREFSYDTSYDPNNVNDFSTWYAYAVKGLTLGDYHPQLRVYLTDGTVTGDAPH